MRQSGPDSGFGLQAKVVETFQVGTSSLGRGMMWGYGPGRQRYWYDIAEQPAPAPHLAHTEGRAAVTHMC
jgi:hypothetical protein